MNKTLEITTKIGCRNKCVYCCQDKLLKAYKGNEMMSLIQFQSILDHTPKEVQIDFTGFCEPFLNPEASLMMWYSIKSGYKTVLSTTLSGFTKHDAEIIEGLKFEKFLVHEYEGVAINYDIFEAKLALISGYERFKLTPEFRFSRAGNLWEMDSKQGEIECGWDNEFSRNVVLPNGDVYLCCMDYSLKHKIGNIYRTHYNDLNRKKLKGLMIEGDIICRKCEISRNKL
jgi:radical SAM protein with 4Fe4S-binding SPASM domain